MYEVLKTETGKPIKAWIKGVQLEDAARQQLYNLSELPFIHKHIAAMPDVHWGMGATVGSVIATKGAIIPAAVGVDIGCGMNAVRTSLTASDLPDSLAALRHEIERSVPVGFNQHKREEIINHNAGLLPPLVGNYIGNILAARLEKAAAQLGTLGGGNHFIEVCLDESQQVWIMLHSGSRGIGNQIGREFITQAKELMERFHINLPDKDLAYFPSDTRLFHEYVEAVGWCQAYAFSNREAMMRLIVGAMVRTVGNFGIEAEAINCHHNYVNLENHFGSNVYVTRKGAVSAHEGQLGIIPGSMGTKSFIVRGKGNPESFYSCSHGAGRAMSRIQAGKQFTLEDHIRDTAGVECRKDIGVIDETPGAYKPIADVMAAQDDLVDVVHTLKQVLCVKG